MYCSPSHKWSPAPHPPLDPVLHTGAWCQFNFFFFLSSSSFYLERLWFFFVMVFSLQEFYQIMLECVFLLTCWNCPAPNSIMVGGNKCPHTNKQLQWVSYNSTRSRHYLPGDGISFYGLRAQYHKATPLTHFRYKLWAHVMTCGSDQPATDWRFPWPPPWTSDAVHESRLLLALLINWLEIRSSRDLLFGFH